MVRTTQNFVERHGLNNDLQKTSNFRVALLCDFFQERVKEHWRLDLKYAMKMPAIEANGAFVIGHEIVNSAQGDNRRCCYLFPLP